MNSLSDVELNIIDKCNYRCNNCSSFSNHSRMDNIFIWDDYKDIYSEWSKKIPRIGIVCISGGEPLLNPSVNEWINGIANLWDYSLINIETNSSNIFNINGLYETLRNLNGRVLLDVHTHSVSDRQILVNKLKSGLFLNDDITIDIAEDFSSWGSVYDAIKDDDWDVCNSVYDFKKLPKYIRDECRIEFHINDVLFMERNTTIIVSDSNNVSLKLSISDSFNETPLIYDNDGVSLHDNDISTSFKNCKLKKTPYFYKGKLYRCKTMALLPEIINGQTVGSEVFDLISSYEPLTLSNCDLNFKKFKDSIKKGTPIPQCKFCPKNDNASLNRNYW